MKIECGIIQGNVLNILFEFLEERSYSGYLKFRIFCDKGICDIKGVKSAKFANIWITTQPKIMDSHKYSSWALERGNTVQFWILPLLFPNS